MVKKKSQSFQKDEGLQGFLIQTKVMKQKYLDQSIVSSIDDKVGSVFDVSGNLEEVAAQTFRALSPQF
jgi:rRNA processing protein Gar1